MQSITVGEVFNQWLVLGETWEEKPYGRRRQISCRCSCGTLANINPADLTKGRTRMCRKCSAKCRPKGAEAPQTVHGLSNTGTQWVWSDMKRRCLSPERRGYANYGGRGIKIQPSWVDGEGIRTGFHCFLLDMGERPTKKHQLDRVDNDGDYTKDNCRWANREEQDYNKRNTFKFQAFGRTWNLKEASEATGFSKGMLFARMVALGFSPELALTQPHRDGLLSKLCPPETL